MLDYVGDAGAVGFVVGEHEREDDGGGCDGADCDFGCERVVGCVDECEDKKTYDIDNRPDDVECSRAVVGADYQPYPADGRGNKSNVLGGGGVGDIKNCEMEQGVKRKQHSVQIILIQKLADSVLRTVRPAVGEDGEGGYLDGGEENGLEHWFNRLFQAFYVLEQLLTDIREQGSALMRLALIPNWHRSVLAHKHPH